ncbi:MAG: GNAT family N-acetyltransferase [Rhizobiaceae bacterium]
MTTSVTIRHFRDSDEAQIIAIVRELQDHETQFYDRLKPSAEIGPWYVDWIREDNQHNNGFIIVADISGLAVGYATLNPSLNSEESREEVFYEYAHVGDLAVLKSHRNRGIGHLLLAECERLAKEAGRKWLRLGVHAGNVDARRFYERFQLRERFLTLEKLLE